MLLLLMRHGIAEPISTSAPDDFQRPLTHEGRDRAHRAARGLHELVPTLDFLASSPKIRARATAQIVRDVFGKKAPPLTEWSELMADDAPSLQRKLAGLKAQTVLLCGHEPHLSRFASQLLSGSAERLQLEWKKAGICALEVEFAPSSARLLWHLTPKQLRKIGK
ncbi:MAG: phosphohistidine phosphatase SixA [Armatimonadetes bacterium]|nr:phosphohistidine phosphatase SixA [Armatimonadota bacterium]